MFSERGEGKRDTPTLTPFPKNIGLSEKVWKDQISLKKGRKKKRQGMANPALTRGREGKRGLPCPRVYPRLKNKGGTQENPSLNGAKPVQFLPPNGYKNMILEKQKPRRRPTNRENWSV